MDLACKEFVELVTAYLEGELSADERARFEAHMSGCGGCKTYLAQMEATIHLTGMLSEDDLTPDAKAELLPLFRNWKNENHSNNP